MKYQAVWTIFDLVIAYSRKVANIIKVDLCDHDLMTDVEGELTSFHLRLQVNTAGRSFDVSNIIMITCATTNRATMLQMNNKITNKSAITTSKERKEKELSINELLSNSSTHRRSRISQYRRQKNIFVAIWLCIEECIRSGEVSAANRWWCMTDLMRIYCFGVAAKRDERSEEC